MFLTVHTYGIWRGSRGRVINTDLIKEMKSCTIGNFQTDTNTKITFTDGTTLKVIDSIADLRSMHNCGRPAAEN